jgi:hypothetical protein
LKKIAFAALMLASVSVHAASWDQVWRVTTIGTATLMTGAEADIIAADDVYGYNTWTVRSNNDVYYGNTFVANVPTTGSIKNLDARTGRLADVYDDQGQMWNLDSWDKEVRSYGTIRSMSDGGYDPTKDWWINSNGDVMVADQPGSTFIANIAGLNPLDIDAVSDDYAYVYNDDGSIWGVDALTNSATIVNPGWVASDHDFNGAWIAHDDGRITRDDVNITTINGEIAAIDSLSSSSAYVYVSLAAVPVPPAILLFGSALAGLGWLRRKQTV